MPLEIERKFLIINDTWRTEKIGVFFRQGYLCHNAESIVRVRITGPQEAWLTIKSRIDELTRLEYEYPIPLADATEMLDRLCHNQLVEKIRYNIPYADLVWEIDEFQGNNAGLLIAEVELNSSDQHITLPPWVGEEVTQDRRYYNNYLAIHPYKQW
ncbi:adenylate cyclase [Achromatium sp. WMS3]|nr:adenylate cyclase [Achromatium sp. WMS3]